MRIFNRLLYILFATVFLSACSKSQEVDITVMTFNIENGGAQVDFKKVVEAIKKSDADVVGIQEAWGNIPRLAKELHWQYYNQSQHIISRLPLYETKDKDNIYLFIEVAPNKFVAMANMHLPDEQYGIELLAAGKSKDEIENVERKMRLPTALTFIDPLATLAKQDIPVILTGDFNSISHLDRKSIQWPVTVTLEQKGFIDTFRTISSDPVKDPGYTWPAARPFLIDAIDHFNPSVNDKPVRIDFIFTAGPSTTIHSSVIDATMIEPWPSDHYAVLSHLKVIPKTLSKNNLTATELTNVETPTISVSQQSAISGEPFVITWANAPGNRYDYIRIAPVESTKLGWGEAVRLYTQGKINGSIEYNARDAKGNWLAWHQSEEGRWPMVPGKYSISLMLDDGFTILAQTQIDIKTDN